MVAHGLLQKLKTLLAVDSGWLHAINVSMALKTTALLAALAAFYFQDLSIIFNDALHDEATSHVLAIPLLLAYIAYRKRKMLIATIAYQPSDQSKNTKQLSMLCGVLLCATAVILYWYGSYSFTPLEYHVLTLPIFAAGLTLVLFNPQTLRQAAFPIGFLVFLMPPPSEILYGLGSTLSVVSSEASSALVNLLGVPATLSSEYGNPTIVIARPDQTTIGFTVDIACSGIYSLIGFFIFAAFIAYITRDRIWKKTVMFLLGLPIIYLLNILRITIILLLGYQFGEELALQTFHLLGGWALILLGTLLLLVIVEKVFKTRWLTRPQACSDCRPQIRDKKADFCTSCGRVLNYARPKAARADLLKIVIIFLLVAFLLYIQVPLFVLTKGPPQIMVGGTGAIEILPQIPDYTLRFEYRDQEFEQKAKQDASLIYAYHDENRTKDSVWVAIEVAQTRGPLHRWETCLITWPQTHGYEPKVTQLDLKDVQVLQNPPLIARFFAFQYTAYNQTQLVLYWFETSIFTMNDTSQQKQVKISLITYPDASQNLTEAENRLLPFAAAIAGHWQPMKMWGQISLILSRNGDKLGLATTALLAATIAVWGIEKRKVKVQNMKILGKLSQEDKQLVDIVRQTEASAKTTMANIVKVCQEGTNKMTKPETIIDRLTQLQETGLIKKQAISIDDEPIIVWRTNL
jgi:exosortase